MFAVLGEDNSDVEMLTTLVKRIAKTPNLSVKKKGYMGCAELLNKAAKQIGAYSRIGCTKFIICYDSDRSCPEARLQELIDKVVKKSDVDAKFCALVPVQELEAWILADLSAVSKIIPSWKPEKLILHPEQQNDPKEFLEKLSRNAKNKPLYSHALHNPRVAAYISLEQIVKKCPSALPLFELVQSDQGNVPQPKYDSLVTRQTKILAAL